MKIRTGPDGLHFFNRLTGMNVLLDEAIIPPALWADAPRQVSVALTNTCDLQCPHCYAPKHKANLDSARLMGWLEQLDAHGCLGVGFGGGEPTLYPELPQLCQHLTRNTALAVTFTTHAHRLDDRMVSKLHGYVNFIRVSIDGVGATYELIRGRPFANIYNKFEIVRKLAPFGINFVVNALTLQDLDVAVALAAEVGASEFLLLPERPVHGSSGIDSFTAQKLLKWVEAYQGPIPLSVSEDGSAGLATCDPLSKEVGLRAYAHIDASGVLKQSSYDYTGIPIGESGVMNALNTLRLAQEDHK